MSLGFKGSGESSYRSLWGKWFVISGCFIGLIAFVLSSWITLWPNLPLIGSGTTNDHSWHLYSHGAYYFKLDDGFVFNDVSGEFVPNFPNMANVSLSPVGVFSIILMILAVICPLIGYAQSRAKLFKIENANKMFMWFTFLVCGLGVLATIASLISIPSSMINGPKITYDDQDPPTILGWQSQCFKCLFFNTNWAPNDPNDGVVSNLLTINNDGYVFLGLVLFSVCMIILVAFYAFRSMFWNISAREEVAKKKVNKTNDTITL